MITKEQILVLLARTRWTHWIFSRATTCYCDKSENPPKRGRIFSLKV